MSDVLHIYTRVSTIAQADEGLSLDVQRELGIKRAEQLGFEHKVWNEGGKSSNHEELNKRPVLSQLLNEIKTGAVKHLFVYDQSRLSRNDTVSSIFRIECNKQGVTLYNKEGKYDLGNPQDQFMKQIMDAMGQFDNAQRTERTRLGKLARVRQGYWLGGPPPFGYEIKDRKLVINEVEAKWVSVIFERYADRVSMFDIKLELDRNGVEPRRKKGTWTIGSLQALMRNTHYVGYWHFKDGKTGEEVRNECPRILSSDLWVRVQATKKRYLEQRSATNPTKHFYMLRGILRCGHCGTLLAGIYHEKQNKQHYYCPKKERVWGKLEVSEDEKWKRGRVCAMTRFMNIDTTDALVWDEVMKAVANSKLMKETVRTATLGEGRQTAGVSAKERKSLESKIRAAEKEIAKLKGALTDLESDRLMGRITLDQYPVIRRRINEEILSSEAKIDTARARLDGMDQQKNWINWIGRFQKQIAEYQDSTPEQRKEVLEGLLTQIDVHLIDKRTHRLDIQFRIPLVGDGLVYKDVAKKSHGYTITEGSKTLSVSASPRLYAKKNE